MINPQNIKHPVLSGLILLTLIALPFQTVLALTGEEMIEHMRRAIQFFPNATLSQTVQTEASWHDKPGSKADLSDGIVVDHWRVMTDQQRSGLERHRESPQGERRTRSVYLPGSRQVFEFGPTSAEAGSAPGQLAIRNQEIAVTYFRVPIMEYTDRILTTSGRYPMDFQDINLENEQDIVDGYPCARLSGIWYGREFTLWLDADYDYLPRKYTIRADASRQRQSFRRLGGRPADRWVFAPPPEYTGLQRPHMTEERMSSVVLERAGDRPYIASAIIEETQFYPEGISYNERQTLRTDAIALQPDPEVDAFVTFKGLLRDGTPVEVQRDGGPLGSDSVDYFVMANGEMVPSSAPKGTYVANLWRDLSRLVTDFNIENLRRIDSRFLIAVCALSAIGINGGIAYAAHRRKKTKPS